MKTKIFAGAQVTSAKHGEGVITRIITKSTGYVEVRYSNGNIRKEMAFNLNGEDGQPLKTKPASETAGMSRGDKKRLRDQRELEAFNALPNQKRIERRIADINGKIYGDEHSLGVQLIHKLLYQIQDIAKEKGNNLVSDIIDAVVRSYRASDGQAYIIAKYADENGVIYE
jgi:hypothetical protein